MAAYLVCGLSVVLKDVIIRHTQRLRHSHNLRADVRHLLRWQLVQLLTVVLRYHKDVAFGFE